MKSNKAPELIKRTNYKHYKVIVATLTLGPKFQSKIKISLQIGPRVTNSL